MTDSHSKTQGQQDNVPVWLYITCLVLLIAASSSVHLTSLKAKMGSMSGAPVAYVNAKLHPENYARDWEYGILDYDYSLPMKGLYLLEKHTGVEATTAMYLYVPLQISLFVLSVAYLSYTLFQNQLTSLISCIICLLSPAAGINLSRFGYGFGNLSPYLFYNYANSIAFFALAAFLRRKYQLSALLLTLSIFSHMTIGLFMSAFIATYFVLRPKLLRHTRIVKAVTLYVCIVSPFVLHIFSSANVSTGTLAGDIWLKSTRIFCYHWYPLAMRSFTTHADKEFLPILILIFCYIVSIYGTAPLSRCHLIIFCGMVGCGILSLIGVFFSEVVPMPALIKLSPQRATGLITFLASLYWINFLCKVLTERECVFSTVISVSGLFALLWFEPGTAIIMPLLLGVTEANFPYTTTVVPKRLYKNFICLLTFAVISTATIGYFLSRSGETFLGSSFDTLKYFSPHLKYELFVKGGRLALGVSAPLFMAGISATLMVLFVIKKRKLSSLPSALVVVILISFLARNCMKVIYWNEHKRTEAESFADVQNWAESNTPLTSLFMLDPVGVNGWRSYSHRSSFGSLPEWGFYCITYNPDRAVYAEAVLRMQALRLNLEEVPADLDMGTDERRYRTYGQKLQRKLKDYFYHLDSQQIAQFAGQFGINYLVLSKKNHQTRFDKFQVQYENSHYIVYSTKN